MRWLNGMGRAVLLAAFWLIASCGGGGGGDGGSVPPPPPPPPNNEPVGTIRGVAQDGLLNDAVVTVYAWNGTRGATLAAGRTDFQGRYSVDLKVASQPVLIEVTGGRYVEEATATGVSLQPGQAMLAVLNYVSGATQTATITYYSTLAAGLAERFSRDGTAAGEAISNATARIGSIVGLDIATTEPTVIAIGTNIRSTPATIDYGFATAALSSYTEFRGIAEGLTPHATINSIAFIQLAYDDIRADGRLDGRGMAGDLFLGTLPLEAGIYRHELALHVLRVADNSLANNTDIRGPDLLPLAMRLNDSTDGIFGSDPLVALGSEAPSIDSVSIADQAVLFGRAQIAVSVASVVGVSRVEAQLIDGNQQNVGGPVVAADPKRPVIMLNTITVPDGPYQLALTATDTVGVSTQKTLAVNVANNQAVIENVSLPTDRPVSGTQIVTATINDPVGVAKVEYLSDGIVDASFPTGDSPDPRTPYVLNTTRFGDGPKTLVIRLTNQQGGTFSKEIMYRTDNTKPGLANITPAAGAFVKQITVAGTATDTSGVVSAEVLIDGVSQGVRTAAPFLPFSAPRPTTDGVKNLVLRVRDLAGNVAEVTRQVTFDGTPPTGRIAAPANGAVVSGGIDFSGVGTDNIGLATVRLGYVEVARNVEINCLLPSNGTQPIGQLSASRPFRVENSANQMNGDYRFTLYVRDQAGNEIASDPVVLTFNNNPGDSRLNVPNPNGTQCFVAP